jgi:hypothetical protein
MNNGKDEQACSKIPTNSIENGSVLCFILMQQQCLVNGADDTTCVMMVKYVCDGLGVSVEVAQTTKGFIFRLGRKREILRSQTNKIRHILCDVAWQCHELKMEQKPLEKLRESVHT